MVYFPVLGRNPVRLPQLDISAICRGSAVEVKPVVRVRCCAECIYPVSKVIAVLVCQSCRAVCMGNFPLLGCSPSILPYLELCPQRSIAGRVVKEFARS